MSGLPYYIVGGLGQSKMSGTGASGAQDVNVSGIFQYVSNTSEPNNDTISGDIVPLHHPRNNGTTPDVIGDLDYFARQIFQNGFVNPATHRLLVVPLGRGSTGIITGGEEWKPTAPVGTLTQIALDQMTEAVAAAQAENPASVFGGFAWSQGENEVNNLGDENNYITAFNQLHSLIKSTVPTAENCWAMVMSMVPEWVKGRTNGNEIQSAHMRLAFQSDDVHFYQANLGGFDPALNIHRSSQGYRDYGAEAADAFQSQFSDPRIVYDFQGDAVGEGSVNELLGTFQRGMTERFNIQNGTSVGLSGKALSPPGSVALANGPTSAAIEFNAAEDHTDISAEWRCNLASNDRQWFTLRADTSNGFGFFGYDGYLFRVDGNGFFAVFNIDNQAVSSQLTSGTTSLGATSTTVDLRASVIGTLVTLEVSNDNRATWTTVLSTNDSTHTSGRAVYMQGGNGTTGSSTFADNFVFRTSVPTDNISGNLVGVEQGQDTFNATGSVGSTGVTGTLTAQETGTDLFSSSGSVFVEGNFSVQEEAQPDVFTATGTVIEQGAISGSLSVTEIGQDTANFSGSVVVSGTVSSQEQTIDVLSATGGVLVEGALLAQETGNDAFTANGTISNPGEESPEVRNTQLHVFVAGSEPTEEANVNQLHSLVSFSGPTPELINSQIQTFVGEGGTSPEVSNRQLHAFALVKGATDDPAVRSWTFTLDGHDFYVIRLGTQETLVYDMSTDQWYQWGTGSSSLWNVYHGENWIDGNKSASLFGSNVLVGSDGNGALFFLDPDGDKDDPAVGSIEEGREAQPFLRRVTGQLRTRGYQRANVYEVQLIGTTGELTETELNTITLTYSDDRGENYSGGGTVTIPANDFEARASWRSLGSFSQPGRLIRIEDDGALRRIDSLTVRTNMDE